MKMHKGSRLHIAAALFTSLKLMKELLVPLLILALTQGFSNAGGRFFYWRLVLGIALVAGAFVWGFIRWALFRYKVEDGLLQIEEGVLIRKKQSIPLARIQAVDFAEEVLLRLLGLVRVRIQTAGGSGPEAELPAVTRKEALRLEALLRQPAGAGCRSAGPEEQPEGAAGRGLAVLAGETAAVSLDGGAGSVEACSMPVSTASSEVCSEPDALHRPEIVSHSLQEASEAASILVAPGACSSGLDASGPVIPQEVFRLPVPHLLAAGMTTRNLGVGISLLFALLSQAEELFPSLELVRLLARTSGWHAWLVLVPVALVLAWILAAASSVLRFSGFRVLRRGGELFIVRGLLERRKVTLPVGRIQAVRIVQEWVWKPFGLAAVHVVCAGYGEEKGESTLLLPLVPVARIGPLLTELCPGISLDLTGLQLPRLPRKAVWSYLLPGPLGTGIAVAVVGMLLPKLLWGLTLLPFLLALYGRAYAKSGFARFGEHLILRRSFLNDALVIVPVKRVQSTRLVQTPFQRRSGLCTLVVSVAGEGSKGAYFRIKGVYAAEAMACITRLRQNG